MIKYNKSKVLPFLEHQRIITPPSLSLRPLKEHLLQPKDNWKYLGFIFDRKLTFHQHIHFYTNKVLSIIKGIKMLGNSTKVLSPTYKQLLSRMCIMSIALYGFQLWYYKGVPLFYPLNELNKI